MRGVYCKLILWWKLFYNVFEYRCVVSGLLVVIVVKIYFVRWEIVVIWWENGYGMVKECYWLIVFWKVW